MYGEAFTRLRGLDASFLHHEVAAAGLAIGGYFVVDGEPPTIEEFRRRIARRLDNTPRFHQRLREAPYPGGRACWVDDAHFNIDYHVRHAALPPPGDPVTLWRFVAQTFGERLDRSKPLWETYLVEGVDGNAFAMLLKCHHALADGMANVALGSLLFDIDGTASNGGSRVRWSPRPEPSPAEVTRDAAKGAVELSIRAMRATVDAAQHPLRTSERLRDIGGTLGELGRVAFTPAPETPFNASIGAGRHYAVITVDLAEVKAARRAFDATVNDVVLTLAAGGLADLLRERGIEVAGLELVASVPVSIRNGSATNAGNQVLTLRARLPVDVDDPALRLEMIKREMARVKRSPQAAVVGRLESAIDAVPDFLLGPLARLSFSPRIFNVLVTNLPGPQFPLTVHGRPVRHMMPVPFLMRRQGIAIAVLSYNGELSFGVLGDPAIAPDLQPVIDGIRRSLDILAAARADAALT